MGKIEDIERELQIDPPEIKQRLVRFIEKTVEDADAEGVVFGLSGGLDSSTVAFLCAEVLEGEKVLALSLPEKGVTNPEETKDADKVAQMLGIDFRSMDISPILEELQQRITDFDEKAKLPAANVKPRVRMTILYYYANLLDRLVVGTNNRSEIRAGYFTKYGDGASDFAPLGCLYKTQVLELARLLKVPSSILEREPSAGLWIGQIDESELGISYEKLDLIYAGLDLELEPSTIAKAAGVKVRVVNNFIEREQSTAHKLSMPCVPKI